MMKRNGKIDRAINAIRFIISRQRYEIPLIVGTLLVFIGAVPLIENNDVLLDKYIGLGIEGIALITIMFYIWSSRSRQNAIPDHPNPDDQNYIENAIEKVFIDKKIEHKKRRLIKMAAACGAVITIIWMYFGFPTPAVIFAMINAKNYCVKFAERHRDQLFIGDPTSTYLDKILNEKPIIATDQWMKHGKVVVELIELSGDGSSFTRLCVVGGDSMEIVSILENGAWR